jgi:protein tyrosine phosphatase (PTP) superfamily phosphohydrolase (DUF442 family)
MDKLTDIYDFLPLTQTLLTSGQPTEGQFPAVASAGVQAVINLALSTSDNALPDEASVVESLGMQYFHIPVLWENPTRADLDRFFDTMDRHSEQKVFVHCAANMRVSAFVALYRILRLGWDREQALADTNRIWNPYENETWGKFINTVLDT